LNDEATCKEVRALPVLREAADGFDVNATARQLALSIMLEINNPLETLGYLTYLAKIDSDNGARVREYMSLAEEQMAKLASFVRQITLLSEVKPSSLSGLGIAVLPLKKTVS